MSVCVRVCRAVNLLSTFGKSLSKVFPSVISESAVRRSGVVGEVFFLEAVEAAGGHRGGGSVVADRASTARRRLRLLELRRVDFVFLLMVHWVVLGVRASVLSGLLVRRGGLPTLVLELALRLAGLENGRVHVLRARKVLGLQRAILCSRTHSRISVRRCNHTRQRAATHRRRRLPLQRQT